MVQVILTQRIQDAVDYCKSLPNIPSTLKSALLDCGSTDEQPPSAPKTISFTVLADISKFLVENSYSTEPSHPLNEIRDCPFWLFRMCQGSSLVLQKKTINRSKELIEILDACQMKRDQQEYNEMIKSIQPMSIESFREDSVDVKRHLSAIANVSFSMVGCFVAFMWLLAKYSMETRVLASLGIALVVGIAEVVLYIWRFNK